MKQGTVGTYGSESLPNITGSITNTNSMSWNTAASGSGAFTVTNRSTNCANASNYAGSFTTNFNFDASRSTSTYQNNAKVNPDNAEILYVIKF